MSMFDNVFDTNTPIDNNQHGGSYDPNDTDLTGTPPETDSAYGTTDTNEWNPNPVVENGNYATDDSDEEANTDTGQDADTAKKARKAHERIPKLTEADTKSIIDIIDLLDTDTGVEAAKTILGTTSTSKATLLALSTETRGRKLPKLDQQNAKRIIDAIDVLGTDAGIAVAKVITGSASPKRETQLAALTERKTRNQADGLFSRVRKIGSWDADELMMNLALEFMDDRDYAKSLLAVLDAAAPGKEFGKSTGDARKDARNIAEKWGDGVDLGMFNALRF